MNAPSRKGRAARVAAFLVGYGDDLLLIGGLGLIVYATFLLNPVAGLYVTGVILVGLSVLISYARRERR